MLCPLLSFGLVYFGCFQCYVHLSARSKPQTESFENHAETEMVLEFNEVDG